MQSETDKVLDRLEATTAPARTLELGVCFASRRLLEDAAERLRDQGQTIHRLETERADHRNTRRQQYSAFAALQREHRVLQEDANRGDEALKRVLARADRAERDLAAEKATNETMTRVMQATLQRLGQIEVERWLASTGK